MSGAAGSGEQRGALLKAVGFLLAAQLFFNCVDTTGKYLVQEYSVITVSWTRYVFHTIFMVVYAWVRFKGPPPAPKRKGILVVRGVLLLGFASFLFATLKYLPQAEAVAISFTSPLLILLLAGPLLGERVTAARWIAACAGFAGMLIVVRPANELAGIGIVFGILTLACNTGFQLITRHLANAEHPIVTILWTAVVGAIGSTILLPFAPPDHWPTTLQAVLFLSMGITGSICHLLLIEAYRLVPASYLAPFIYVHIAYATAFGLVVFGQFPDAVTLLGIAVIGASGAGIAMYERAQAARRAAAASA